MAYRILIQLLFFALPFLAYGLYRLLIADAEADGRKAWPVHILFAIGAGLAAGVWLYFIFREDKSRDLCVEPPRIENGVLIESRRVPCEQDVRNLGIPRTESPGRPATGATPAPGYSDEIAADTPGSTRGEEGLPEPEPIQDSDD